MWGTGPVRARVLIVVALFAGTGTAGAVELDFGIVKTLEHLSLPVPNPARPIVCHGFGCAYQTPIQFRPGDLAQIRKVFGPAGQAVEQRKAVAATAAGF